MDISDKLFEFDGRLRRRDWWLLSIGLGLFQYVITQVVGPLVLGDDGRMQMTPGSFLPTYPIPLLVLMMAMSAIMLWPTLALVAKRAHDRGVSATPAMALTVITVAASWGAVLAGMGGTPDFVLMGLAGLVNIGIGLYQLVTLGILDGTPGPNDYGPSPKGYGDYGAISEEFA